MSLLFSAVTATVSDQEVELLVGGIPREIDDLEGWTAFDRFMEAIDEKTEVYVHAEAYRHAESAVKRILQNQVDGSYYLQASNLPDPIQNPMFDYQLLGQMLSERPEFAAVETMSSEILVSVAPEYQTEEIDEASNEDDFKRNLLSSVGSNSRTGTD